MLEKLPKKFDPYWLVVLLIYIQILWIILAGSKLIILNGVLNYQDFSGLFWLAIGISLLINLLGFFGARYTFALANLGLLAGVIAMIVSYKKGGGWEDLTGPVVLVEMFLIGVITGIGVEIFMFYRRKIKR